MQWLGVLPVELTLIRIVTRPNNAGSAVCVATKIPFYVLRYPAKFDIHLGMIMKMLLQERYRSDDPRLLPEIQHSLFDFDAARYLGIIILI